MNTEFKVTSNLHGLARRLVAEDILDSAAAEKAVAESARKNKTLLGWLIANNAADAGLHALGLDTGLSHMEWFLLADGRIAISEVGARPPGAQITSLLSYAHDIDFYRAWPHLMVFGEFAPPPRQYAAGAAYIRGQGRGTVRHIHGLDDAQRRFGDIVVEARLPREGQPPSDSYEGDGYVIVRHPDTAVVENALTEIVKTIRVELA